MIPDTLRLRLPLTYAAIALLAVLALGAVLLTGLRNIYHREELNYLIGNAAVIAESIAAPMREAPLPAGWLQAQAEGLAFLTQTRIRVTNESAGTVLADSGDPGSTDGSTRIALDVTVGDVAQSFSQAIEQTGDQSTTSYTSSIIVEAPSSSRNIDQTVVITQATDGPPPSRLPTIGTLFGFGLDPAVAAATTRSNVTVRQPIIGPVGRFWATSNCRKARPMAALSCAASPAVGPLPEQSPWCWRPWPAGSSAGASLRRWRR